MRILIHNSAFSSFSTFISLIMSSITAVSCALKGSVWGNRWMYERRVFLRRFNQLHRNSSTESSTYLIWTLFTECYCLFIAQDSHQRRHEDSEIFLIKRKVLVGLRRIPQFARNVEFPPYGYIWIDKLIGEAFAVRRRCRTCAAKAWRRHVAYSPSAGRCRRRFDSRCPANTRDGRVRCCRRGFSRSSGSLRSHGRSFEASL